MGLKDKLRLDSQQNAHFEEGRRLDLHSKALPVTRRYRIMGVVGREHNLGRNTVPMEEVWVQKGHEDIWAEVGFR